MPSQRAAPGYVAARLGIGASLRAARRRSRPAAPRRSALSRGARSAVTMRTTQRDDQQHQDRARPDVGAGPVARAACTRNAARCSTALRARRPARARTAAARDDAQPLTHAKPARAGVPAAIRRQATLISCRNRRHAACCASSSHFSMYAGTTRRPARSSLSSAYCSLRYALKSADARGLRDRVGEQLDARGVGAGLHEHRRGTAAA